MEKRHEIEKYVKARVAQFKTLGEKGCVTFNFKPFMDLRFKVDLLSELVFCISTANSSARAGILFQNMFCNSKDRTKESIYRMLRIAKVRFPHAKAGYIVLAIQKHAEIIKQITELSSTDARELLVKNIKGMGYKEASHFLRNIGRDDVAILDRHILKWLVENEYLSSYPKNMSRKKYLEIENMMKDLARKEKITLSELDLYL
jgi:N-glycosylase/DNA lyase